MPYFFISVYSCLKCCRSLLDITGIRVFPRKFTTPPCLLLFVKTLRLLDVFRLLTMCAKTSISLGNPLFLDIHQQNAQIINKVQSAPYHKQTLHMFQLSMSHHQGFSIVLFKFLFKIYSVPICDIFKSTYLCFSGYGGRVSPVLLYCFFSCRIVFVLSV